MKQRGHLIKFSALCLFMLAPFSAKANLNWSLGLSFGRGNYYPSAGAPIFGGGYNGMIGVCGNACQFPPAYLQACGYNPYAPHLGGGIYGPGGGVPGGIGGGIGGSIGGLPGLPGLGGGMIGGIGGAPATPLLPPPQPYLPPHIVLGGGLGGGAGWGPGFGSYPYPGMAPTPGCISCNAGYIPQPLYPVPGGPVMQNCPMGIPYGGSCHATGASTGLYRGIAGGYGTTVIDMRSRNAWEMEDSGEIVFNAGLGMSSMLTNVYPVAFPRQEPTLIPPGWFNWGPRESIFDPRPHY